MERVLERFLLMFKREKFSEKAIRREIGRIDEENSLKLESDAYFLLRVLFHIADPINNNNITGDAGTYPDASNLP